MKKTDGRFATGEQFAKIVLRWMPPEFSCMPEGELIAAMLGQAWQDGEHWFFRRNCHGLKFYCKAAGLDIDQICDAYEKYNKQFAQSIHLA